MATANTLSALLGRSRIEDHDEVLKAANAVLKTSKTDTEAQHVKLVALLKLDRYNEALDVLATAGSALQERAALEHAYALYKVGKSAEAAQVARRAQGRGGRHVEAQASYRSEDFARAAELYAELSNANGQVSNEDVDMRINSSAVDAQLEWAGQGHLAKSRKPGREDLEAFETAYNAACGSIARGELVQAEILLKRSKDLCNALDDLTEDDKRAELLPITVQQVYVLSRLGKMEEVKRLSESIVPKEVSDVTTKNIAQVNVLTATQSQNPFILQRLAASSGKVPPSDQPFAFQKAALRQNSNAINLSAQKIGGPMRASRTSTRSQTAPTLDSGINSMTAFGAAAKANAATGKHALKLILPELERRPKDIGLILIVVQLYVLTGNHDTATLLLEKFLQRLEESTSSSDLDSRFAPGLVGSIVALYSIRGQSSHIRQELAKASAHWRHRSKDVDHARAAAVANLLKTAAGALADSQSAEDQSLARATLDDIRTSASNDGYIQAASIAASVKAHSTGGADLIAVDKLVSGIDVDAIENAGIARPLQAKAVPSGVKRSADSSDAPKKKRKIKPSKMPKDFDPNKAPDPERWLPLRDRSTYKPKGKKGKQRANMLAQGAVEDTTRPNTPQQSDGQKGSTGGGGGNKGQPKKKKGKGGKW